MRPGRRSHPSAARSVANPGEPARGAGELLRARPTAGANGQMGSSASPRAPSGRGEGASRRDRRYSQRAQRAPSLIKKEDFTPCASVAALRCLAACSRSSAPPATTGDKGELLPVLWIACARWRRGWGGLEGQRRHPVPRGGVRVPHEATAGRGAAPLMAPAWQGCQPARAGRRPRRDLWLPPKAARPLRLRPGRRGRPWR